MTRFFHRSRYSFGVVLLLGVALILTGCDSESLNTPEIANSGQTDGLFNRYVAIGNSITAGLQSAGISVTTQEKAYPVLLAKQMGTPFQIPSFNPPGCPPPLASFPPSPRTTDCAFRSNVGSRIHNVAVPGAFVSDVLSNEDPNDADTPPGPNELTQFILGGRTQIQAALDANPTFTTVWIGNNDVLAAANAGTTALATPPDAFENNYRSLVNQLLNNDPPLKGGVLVGVADVSNLPGMVLGQVYYQIRGQLPSNLTIANSCQSNKDGGVGSDNRVSFLFFLRQLGNAFEDTDNTFEIDCADGNPGALTPSELKTLSDRAETFNKRIESIANGNDKLTFFDPNDAFGALVSAGEVPPTPNFNNEDPLFGDFFSLDGVHPSDAAHQLVADQLIKTINAAYDAEIDRLENAPPLP